MKLLILAVAMFQAIFAIQMKGGSGDGSALSARMLKQLGSTHGWQVLLI
jgi:hypothetical protein